MYNFLAAHENGKGNGKTFREREGTECYFSIRNFPRTVFIHVSYFVATVIGSSLCSATLLMDCDRPLGDLWPSHCPPM